MDCGFCKNATSSGCQFCNPIHIGSGKLDSATPEVFGRPKQYGWECPKCHAVMGPAMPVCVNCKGNAG